VAATREERRIVTVLFADLVGSTALTERLNPEDARLIVREAIGQVIAVVERYGGYVKDIAGDGVLAFFGAPTAHEDDPERASRAGLDIVTAIGAYARDVRDGFGIDGLSVRVGLDTGEVVVGDLGAGGRVEYGAVGSAVNTAARLQSAADAGTVVVTRTTRGFVRDLFAWGPARHLSLKGIEHEIEAYTLLASVVVPAAATEQKMQLRLVGRERELEVLSRLAASLREGRGGILIVSGAPGVGKSRMATELREMVDAQATVTWLEGKCASYADGLPYWPFRDLLRNWLSVGTQEQELKTRIALKRHLDQVFGAGADDVYPYLGALLGLNLEPDAAARLAQLSAESVQYRTFAVVEELTIKLAAAGPVAVFMDDLHWADPTSLALTAKLASVVEDSPVLIVLAMRPETGSGAWRLQEELTREYQHLLVELRLGSLPAEEGARLVGQLLSTAHIADAIRDQVVGYAGGNPFYLEEISRSLLDRAIDMSHGDVTIDIPTTVEGAILARCDRLDPMWRDVITSASVLGKSFGFELLRAVTRKDESELRDALHNLRRLDLILDVGAGTARTYQFKHVLIQETVYKTLVSGNRQSLHRRAAEWFEAFYADRLERVYGLLAHHWGRADDTDKAVQYTKLAGDRALAEWSLDEAIEQYRALLNLLPPNGTEPGAAEVFFQLATVLHLAMRFGEASKAWADGVERWRRPPPTTEPTSAALIVAVNSVPWSADPSAGYYATNQSLQHHLFDGLFDARPAPYLVPGLANKWTVSDDGLTYRIYLDPGLRWADGAPMLADNVVFAVHRALETDPTGAIAASLLLVEGVEARLQGEISAKVGVHAVGEHEVEIRLTHASPAFIFLMVSPGMSPLRTDLMESGAFHLTSMNESRVEVRREPGYPRRRGGNLARAEYVRLSREEMAEAAAANGVDAIWGNLHPEGTAEDYGMVAQLAPRTVSVFLAFPGVGDLVANRDLRRALTLSLDQERIGGALDYNMVSARGGLVPPGVPGHTPDIRPSQDVDAARDALRASGHRGPLRVITANEQVGPYQDAMVASWREHLGLEVIFNTRPIASNREWSAECNVALWHWVAHEPDASYFLRTLLHHRSPYRVRGWSCLAFDELIDAAVATADGQKRRSLFHEADRMAVQQEFLVVPLAYGSVSVWVKPWVHGWWQWGVPWQTWDELVIDDSSPRFSAGV
jgi:ABC-type transport system substrate-binding protein/class 3 adenylate cyclase